MEDALKQKLMSSEGHSFIAWMRKQPPKQLHKALKDLALQPSCHALPVLPRLFALIQCLAENVLIDEDDWGELRVKSSSSFFKQSEEEMDGILKTFLAAGCDIDEVLSLPPSNRSRKGFTPLLLAIDRRSPSWARALIRAGANVNLTDGLGHSPLHWAVYCMDNVKLIEELVKAGADIYWMAKDVRPLLICAVDDSRIETVMYLLQLGVDVNTSSKYTVIKEKYWPHVASRYSCNLPSGEETTESVEITAVGRAIRMRKLEVLQFLLRNPDARVDMKDYRFCVLEGDTTTANIILESSSAPSPSVLLHDKLEDTDFDTVLNVGKRAFYIVDTITPDTIKWLKTCLKNGLDINKQGIRVDPYKGNITTTLIFVCLELNWRNREVFNFLLENGADLFIDSRQNAFEFLSDRRFVEHQPSAKKARVCMTCDSMFSDFISVVNLLLDKGLSAEKVDITSFLLSHPCLIYHFDVIKKLWWAGGKIDFSLLEETFDKSWIHQNCVDSVDQGGTVTTHKFAEWKCQTLSLQRMAAVTVRRNLRNPGIDGLNSDLPGWPIKTCKEYLRHCSIKDSKHRG